LDCTRKDVDETTQGEQMTEREALKLALEALVNTDSEPSSRSWKREIEAITAVKRALANEALEKMAENARELGLDYEPAKELCGGCKGSGWVSRDPDIGTDQECFVCGGSGVYPKEPEQEPVAIPDCGEAGHADGACGNRECLPSFNRNTTPPQRKPLTDEEIETYRYMIDWTAHWSYINFARAIEAAHGIKGEA
jgi:hypothetical protein